MILQWEPPKTRSNPWQLARPVAVHRRRIRQFKAFPFVTGIARRAGAVNPAAVRRVSGGRTPRSPILPAVAPFNEETNP